MKKELLKIINNYGVYNQLEHFMTEVAELIEAVTQRDYPALSKDNKPKELELYETENIAGELTDCLVMVYQFPLYYFTWLDNEGETIYKYEEPLNPIKEDCLIKALMKAVLKLNKAIIHAEEREQDYISECRYGDVIFAVDLVVHILLRIKDFYNIPTNVLESIGEYKIKRQLERMKNNG